ncbi:MAG: hypothetical protein PVI90_02465 [Desulfobacteraceae bacterium]|jgi:hypothetical protein
MLFPNEKEPENFKALIEQTLKKKAAKEFASFLADMAVDWVFICIERKCLNHLEEICGGEYESFLSISIDVAGLYEKSFENLC